METRSDLPLQAPGAAVALQEQNQLPGGAW